MEINVVFQNERKKNKQIINENKRGKERQRAKSSDKLFEEETEEMNKENQDQKEEGDKNIQSPQGLYCGHL